MSKDVDQAWHEVAGALKALTREDPIAGLRRLTSMRNEIDLHAGTAVEHARRGGKTWDEIGAALGVTRQGAQKRYQGVDALFRCQAAELLASDSAPCSGSATAVWVYDSQESPAEPGKTPGAVSACVEHGARFYAQARYARVYPQAGHGKEALEVYYRADEIRAEQKDGKA